ncbi:MAG: molecular chaperone HtpG [Anaerolineales bacterium]|nr:molecular chaperone HtpG [Anaerolineales bacterium]
MEQNPTQEGVQPIAFKAETRQLLDILIHSLYTEREIFLRELISNASDALTRLDFELLTNREVLDPEAELAIRIKIDPDEKTLTIQDTGIGMTAEEMVANLGTIAHSGARDFMTAARQGEQNISDLIGQFGVGFYSAFMAAEWIRVTSHSYRPEAQAAAWFCTGADTFTVESAEKAGRGTEVTIKLKEDAAEFLQETRLRAIIRKHSDFIPFPIYIGDQTEQANRQTAIWRQSPREVDKKDYDEFYHQLTLDPEPPLAQAHLVVDAPAQLYAILYAPASPERGLFSPRKEEGLKLYARKVLIQEYHRDLLPEYLGFIQGVVDSEDIPLNVSREAVQSNRIMAQIKKLVTSKVLDMLKKLAEDDPERYAQFWKGFGRYLKQGVAIEQSSPEALYPLLRFHTTTQPEKWVSLDEYLQEMKPDQKDIYYIMGDDDRSAMRSPHLDAVRKLGYDVLLMTDPMDAFMLLRLDQYKEHPLSNVAAAELDIPKEDEAQEQSVPQVAEAERQPLIERFKQQLGERVADVRLTERLSDSPARLVDPEGAPHQEMQRVYRLLNREFDMPKKVLELNPRHAILVRLSALPADDPRSGLVIEQIYEDALLIEGLHPDPASMIARIQQLIEAALV